MTSIYALNGQPAFWSLEKALKKLLVVGKLALPRLDNERKREIINKTGNF